MSPLAGIGAFKGLLQRALVFIWEQVRCPGHQGVLLLAIVQAAEHQPVCIGVGHHFVDRPNHNFFWIPVQA